MTDGEAGFRAPAVMERTGLTYRRLDYLVRTEVIKPSIVHSRGSGEANIFSEQDVKIIKIIGQLGELGAQTDVLRKVAGYLQTTPSFSSNDYLIVSFTPPGIVNCKLCSDDALLRVIHDTASWVVNISQLQQNQPEFKTQNTECLLCGSTSGEVLRTDFKGAILEYRCSNCGAKITVTA